MPYDWQGRQILYFDLLHPIGEYNFVNESPVIIKWADVETFVVFVVLRMSTVKNFTPT